MRIRWQASLGMLLVLACAPTQARIEDLRHFFRDVQSFEARFEQQVLDDQGATIQQSSGRLFIQRPGRFRWDYQQPYVQQVVGDGARLWVYDRDLRQVTVRKLKGALGETPAQWLAGRVDPEREFRLRELGREAGLDWIEMEPKAREGGFARVRVGFAAGRLSVIELMDTLGQTTRIALSEVRENPKIDPARFVFEPPAGVDVVGE